MGSNLKCKLSIDIRDKLQRGYCIVSYDDDEFIINSLHVLEYYRKQGIASSLLKLAESVIYDLGGAFSCLYIINNLQMNIIRNLKMFRKIMKIITNYHSKI